MKTYVVSRGTGGQVGCTVVQDNGQPVTILKHCVHHSPDGFETGYGGSGPADLALSILDDHFEIQPTRNANIMDTRAWVAHQPFKFHFIAPRKLQAGESYQILGSEIAYWLSGLERGVEG